MRVDLEYDIPPAVKSLHQGWILTTQNGPIIAALFVNVSVLLLTLFKNNDNFDHANPAFAQSLLRGFCYASFFLLTSAAVSSFLLIDMLGEMPVRASAMSRKPPREGELEGSSLGILRSYGAGRLWSWLMWHWALSLLVGIWCLILQVLTYVWMQESFVIKIVMSCIVGLTILPVTASLLIKG